MDIIYNDTTQKWELKKEPYATIEVASEEDFEWFTRAMDFYMAHSEAQPVLYDGAFGACPNCEYEFNSELRNEYEINYCPICGQKLDWRENDGMDQR